MWLYMFCIIVEDVHGWLSQECGAGLRWKGSRVAVYVCIIVEDMNGWLSQEGGGGFKMEGESCD